jgi:hypothetical protein
MVLSSPAFLSGSITNTVTGDAGGIAGNQRTWPPLSGFITDCYSTATVTGVARVGGLVGWNYYATVIKSYSTGAVAGSAPVGGLIGQSVCKPQPLIVSGIPKLQADPQAPEAQGSTTSEMTYPYAANTFDTWNFIHLWAKDAAYSKNNGYPFFGFPSEYSSPNLVIEDGNSGCFDSEDKIVLAGGGTHFLLESGASLELAAVNSIILKDGFRAIAGSYGHFFIDPSGSYCNPPSMLSVEEESFIEPEEILTSEKSVRAYPNPTTGLLNIDLTGFDSEVSTITEVFGNMGERIFWSDNLGQSSITVDLSDRPSGIYILRISNGDHTSVQKIVRH